MLRLTALARISSKQFSRGVFSTHKPKQTFRESKSALQVGRRRAQVQQANFDMQQDMNQRFGERQREYARSRRSMQRAAEDLMYHRAHHAEQRAGRAGQHYVTARDRADEMATARQLLQMQESARRVMKRGKTARTEAFRAEKRWSR